MEDQKQADIVDKMIKSSGKFNGSGFSEWYEQALDCFRLRSEGILAIVQGQPCPRPVYQTARQARRSRSMSRERRRTTAESRAVAAQAQAAAAARAAEDATAAAIAAGNDNDGAAARARQAAVQAAAEAATAAAAAADAFEDDGDNSESSTASSDVPVDFTYESVTELPTSLIWTIPETVTNREEIMAWHRYNRMLGTFLSMCTTGAAKKFVATFKPKPDMMFNGIAAWKALVKKYRNPSRQRQKILFKKLYNMTMDVDQDPDAFLHDMTELRDELQLLGSPIPDDQFLNIILDCLPEQLYSGIKYEAETKEDLTLEQAVYTMRNLYINRKEESGTSRAAKGRSSAMSATTASSKFCSFCKKKGHTVDTCWSRNKKPAGNNPGGRRGDWCSLHKTSRHDNSVCRAQNNRNGGGGSRGRQQQGRHQGQRNQGQRFNNGSNSLNNNASAGQQQNTSNNQANYGQTPAAPSSTTMVEYYHPAGQQAPGSATTALAAPAPPSGVGFSFVANSTAPAPTFTMTVDTGASSHFLDSELLPDLEQRMIECTKIDPPLRITVAGQGQLPGTAKGVLKVVVTDQHGHSHPVRLPFICVPNLGRHLFSGGTARKQGVSTFIGPTSFLDLGVFKIPLRPDETCDTMFHFDLAIASDSVATQHAFPTISGADLPPENANTVSATASSPTAPTTTSGLAAGATAEPSSATALATTSSATASANTWHQRLGHPNVQVLEQVSRIDGSGVVLRDSFSACGTCKINKSTQQNHPKTVNTDGITRRLQLVSTDLLGPVSPTAIGGYNYMAKFTDHSSRLKAVYFIAKKSDALSSLVNFVQDIAIPLGLRVEYLRSDNGGEFVSSEFRHYCKTTGIVQQFSSPHTPQQNGISERDGRTIMNMTRCLLNEANLPRHLWGEIAATSVFLVNRLPHKAIKGDTPYWRMFGKQANLSFLRIIGSRAFVHVEGHTTKLQPRAWEGVLVGYDNDSPTFRIYNRTTGRVTSSRNVTFIETPPAVVPPADSAGDFDTENEPESPDVDNINDGITLLEQGDNSDSNELEPAATISSRLRSSGRAPLPQPDSSNARQARELRQLNVACQDHPQQMLDSYTEYIGAVGLDSVLPPAAVEVPNTFKQAMNSPQSTQWDEAMRKELSSLHDHDVADLIPVSSVPAGSSIIGTRWVFRVKTDGRFKARVVVQGWAQQHGIDCFTTFAPVCRIGSQRLLLAIAAAHGWLVLAMDVQTAFLNGTLSEDVYTYQAPGFEKLDGNGQPLVWKLKKSLYGLRQSPSVWNLTIDKDLRGKGYTPTASDPCVYTKGSGNGYVMLTLFVDDILLTGPSTTVLQEARQDLQRSFAMTDLGPATQILGIEINQDLEKGTITLSQEKYTLSILKRFKMDSCNPSHTPGTGVDDKGSTATPLSDADKKEYQSLVGSLIFLINCTRYDIAFATMMAARSMSSPTQRDLANAKRILRYLKKQPDLDITYRRDAKFELTLYSDASYAQAPGYKSTSGSMAFLSGALVHFNSQTQRILAQSSSEAEVIAVNTAAKQGVYLTNIMGELGWHRLRTFHLLTDNRSALSLVANGAFSSRSKHIAVRYNALREWAKENRFRLDFVPSESMLADICTKYCTRDIFNSLIKQVQAHC